MELIVIIALIVALIICVYFLARKQKAPNTINDQLISKEKELASSLEKNNLISLQIDELKQELRQSQQQAADLQQSLSASERELSLIRQEREELLSKNQSLQKDNQETKQTLTSCQSEIKIMQERYDNLDKQHSQLTESSNKQQAELSSKNQAISEENETLKQSLHAAQSEVKVLRERYDNLNKQYEQFIENNKKQQDDFELKIKDITTKIFEEKNKSFTENSTKNLNDIVSPLKEELKQFKEKVDNDIKERVAQHATLNEQIKNILVQSQSVSKEANNLASALKGENKIMGNYGEHILGSILQNSGLYEGLHYESQQAYNTEDEDGNKKRLIPDYVIYLPSEDKKKRDCIVVDSKVSMVAYERYCSAESEIERETALKEHLQSVRNHINELTGKNYEQVVEGNINFVMMFIPIEQSYLLAMQSDNGLWEEAYNKRVVLMSATNMISCLKLISNLWVINNRNASAKKIADTAASMYNKFILMLESFDAMGKSLDNTKKAYDEAMDRMKGGRGNFVKKMEDLKKLGVDSKRRLPASFEDALTEEE